MSAYNGYGTSSSLPILPAFLLACVTGLLALAMLGGAGTVQLATPKPTPDEVGGINIDEAVQEARELIPDLKSGGKVGYLWKSAGGYMRVGLSRSGTLFVTPGSPATPALREAAALIAAQLGAIVP